MSEQNLKRKSESDLHLTTSPKRTARDEGYANPEIKNYVNIGHQEEILDNEEESDQNEDGVESENFEYSEIEDEFSDEDGINPSTVDLSNDNYLSFSENEITEERDDAPSKKLRSKDPQPKVKKKRQKKHPNMRKNIRNVLAEKQLDSATQKLREKEMDRLKRLGYAASPIINPSSTSTITASGTLIKSLKRSLSSTKDVICLSSSDEESDSSHLKSNGEHPDVKKSEVFVLSSDSEDGNAVDDDNLADHHSDLGLHTNDLFNKPGEDGRVWINLNKKNWEKKTFLPKHISQILKPHQIGGLRFLFENLIESVTEFRPNLGNGCILAHAMGLGKTIQTITFIDLFLSCTPAHKVLCVVPVNTIQNWSNEFDRWIPKKLYPVPESVDTLTENEMLFDTTSLCSDNDNLLQSDECDFANFSAIKSLLDDMVHYVDENENNENKKNVVEEQYYRDFDVFVIDAQKTWPDRISTIDRWVVEGGVLLIGYEMYRALASGLKLPKLKGRKGKMLLEEKRDLRKAMKEAVCNPGPDLVVCDEGHRIRNYQSGISQSLKNINTTKRLVLTGYPLQNNLIEYWCMVDFVRPDYLGSRQEFANMFERPILNGQCVDSTIGDKRLMRERAHVLYSLLQGFVQRRGHKVFKSILPEKYEHVVMVRMTPVQKALYQRLVELTKEAYSDSLNPIKTFHLCCKIWNHPDILYKAMQSLMQGKEVDIINDDIDNDSSSSKERRNGRSDKKTPATTVTGHSSPFNNQQPATETNNISFSPFAADPREILMDITQWAPEIFQQFQYQANNIENSGKFQILSHLINQTVAEDDKMLVFSQSLLTLSAIEDMLKRRPVVEDQPDVCWKKDLHYFRLDGSTTSHERERYINAFNKKSNRDARLFLLSTRAGCLGINLVGANRVVVFDVSWNPCHDAQAVCRVYRYGQTKPCFIYRLVASNTMEKKIYYRQISKQGISNRVVDEMNQTENFSKNEIQSLIAEEWVEEPRPDFSRFVTDHVDHMLTSVVLECPDLVSDIPFKHESLLINEEKTERLTGSEKRAAKRAYEAQKQMSRVSYRPLQPNFPMNSPVAPVRPFSWRPPTGSSAMNNNYWNNPAIRLSFPVMVGGHNSTGPLLHQRSSAFNYNNSHTTNTSSTSAEGIGFTSSTTAVNRIQSFGSFLQTNSHHNDYNLSISNRRLMPPHIPTSHHTTMAAGQFASSSSTDIRGSLSANSLITNPHNNGDGSGTDTTSIASVLLTSLDDHQQQQRQQHHHRQQQQHHHQQRQQQHQQQHQQQQQQQHHQQQHHQQRRQTYSNSSTAHVPSREDCLIASFVQEMTDITKGTMALPGATAVNAPSCSLNNVIILEDSEED